MVYTSDYFQKNCTIPGITYYQYGLVKQRKPFVMEFSVFATLFSEQ